ncbi:MAG: hypothetical protein ACLQBJ_01120 [Bryobacteraceae bacterium]
MRAAAAWLAGLAALAAGEVLDRVAVQVGTQVITESAVRRELRLEAFMQDREAELGAAERRKAAERLIDQTLVRRELELNRYPPPPASEVQASVEQIRKARREDPSEFAHSLERNGFSLEDLRNQVLYEIALLRFVDFRFSPGVEVSDAEIQQAYEKEVVPEAQRRGVAAPRLDEQRESIVKLLSYRKTTAALEQWLGQARQQVKIRYYEEAFR